MGNHCSAEIKQMPACEFIRLIKHGFLKNSSYSNSFDVFGLQAKISCSWPTSRTPAYLVTITNFHPKVLEFPWVQVFIGHLVFEFLGLHPLYATSDQYSIANRILNHQH